MQFILEKGAKPKTLGDSAISIPNSIYTSKIFGKDLDINYCYSSNNTENILSKLLTKQHPLIHTWLVLSSISICFLSALFFIFP